VLELGEADLAAAIARMERTTSDFARDLYADRLVGRGARGDPLATRAGFVVRGVAVGIKHQHLCR